MPLRAHLVELRKRVGLAAIGLVLGAVVGWIIYPTVFAILQAPVVQLNEQQGRLIALNFSGIVSAFDMQLKVALFVGVLISSPWWVYQLWAFITPGLTRRERLVTIGFLGAAVPLFLTGAFLAWWLLPKAVGVLTGFTPADSTNLISAQEYLTFVMRIGAVATPTGDAISMLVLALPITALYFIAVGVTLRIDRRAAKREDAQLATTAERA